MKKVDLNKIPTEISAGIISEKEAINIVCSFISSNYPVFGLHKFDEDFRGEVFLSVLEKGDNLFNHYDPNQGDFFNYLYCCITSLVRTKLRTLAQRKIIDSITLTENINNLEDKEYNYNNINYSCFQTPKVPYSSPKISSHSLKEAFQNLHKDKGLLVVAIKSAFYLTDNQIDKICSLYKINKDEFYKTIQYCRELLLAKAEKKRILQDRRTYAYYHHKKYEKQLEIIENSENHKNNTTLKNHILEKHNKQFNNWSKLNKKLKDGLMVIRPSNKTIASILGICERQVTYYMKCARRNYKDSNNDIEYKLD